MLNIVGHIDINMNGEEKMYNTDMFTKLAAYSNLAQKEQTALCSDPEYSAKQEELFNKAEQWLNSLGIETRTEYGNVLPTYNLFLKIGEYLGAKHE